MDISCDSRITHVQVYARGAQIWREVTPRAPLPSEAVDLIVPGLTPLSEPGSLRATLQGPRELVALHSRLVVPSGPVGPGPAVEKLRALGLEAARLDARHKHLTWRHDALARLTLQTGVTGKERLPDPRLRARDALAVSAALTATVAALEAELLALDDERHQLERAREAAELEAAQATSAERAGRGHPTRQVTLRLSAPAGEGPVGIELVYTVSAARWWPAYTARLTDGGAQANMMLDAFVTQASGEDWSDVALALSTADLVRDARLPQLPSLRLGRAQPPPRRGYRPAPTDLDGLFGGYDRARAQMITPAVPVPVIVAHYEAEDEDDDDSDGDQADEPALERTVAPPPPAPMVQRRPVAVGAAAAGGAPIASSTSRAPLRARRGSPGPGPGAASDEAPAEQASDEPSRPEPTAIEPADAWLDFDTLTLAAEGPRRGRLVRSPESSASAEATAREIESLAAPLYTRDPLESRGHFDHRYVADGRVDLPSDGRTHRLTLASARATSRVRFRTVPRESAEVFRQVELENPFEAPLLGGPVDVFVDGGLVTTTQLDPVDRGGGLVLGLGVEDHLRVARNTEVQESSAGLLGGSTVVDHRVRIDLRSSLGREVSLEVIDRVPVSDDHDVEITLNAKPEPERYAQQDRAQPVRGGLRWIVSLPPGGSAHVEFSYRVKLPAKSELVGGNRRE